MAKCKFKLPGIQDLSKDQEDARALPNEGQHLVIGGPGTGKSVLALLRCGRHHRNNEDYVFLVYNHLLNQASKQLFGENLKSQQWQSWFMQTFKMMTEEKVPLLPPSNGKSWQDTDWDGVLDIIANLEQLPELELSYLIIDEGQDMPPQFYQALINLGFENFFIVADFNQQIDPVRNSHPTKDIAPLFLYEPLFDSDRNLVRDNHGCPVFEKECDNGDKERLINLTTNYRNTAPVAKLAYEFHTDPECPPPDMPIKSSLKIPLIYEYGDATSRPFNELIRNILKTYDRNPNKLIGIITPNNPIRDNYIHALTTVEAVLDNGKPRISTYANNLNLDQELRFDICGIMVINAQSCKGLEFDIVFLADIHEHKVWPAISDGKKRLFYVMVARAKDRIIMLKEAGKYCPVETLLPKDPDILRQ